MRIHRRLALCSALSVIMVTAPTAVLSKEKEEPPKVKIPESGVSQIMTLEGRFVRVAYNNEGHAILGYRAANQSVGEEWLLLDVGLTLRDGVPTYDMPREAFSIETPDGKTIPLATNVEYRNGKTSALDARAKRQSDSINYFPPNARRACRIGFFGDVGSRAPAWDRVELDDSRACMGSLYFHVPDGIAYGQHWLNVKFANSLVRVPFRILTDEEYKVLDKNYRDIEKQVEEAFRKKD